MGIIDLDYLDVLGCGGTEDISTETGIYRASLRSGPLPDSQEVIARGLGIMPEESGKEDGSPIRITYDYREVNPRPKMSWRKRISL